jgi:cardiolipin synthase
MVDDVDARFSRRSAVKLLRRANVPVAVFNPTLVPARLKLANLRNHRKILVVHGVIGFTGGLNIDEKYWKRRGTRESISRSAISVARASRGASGGGLCG